VQLDESPAQRQADPETSLGPVQRLVYLKEHLEQPRQNMGVLEIRLPLPAQLAGRKLPIEIEHKTKELEIESRITYAGLFQPPHLRAV